MSFPKTENAGFFLQSQRVGEGERNQRPETVQIPDILANKN